MRELFAMRDRFLSIQAQDFIEDGEVHASCAGLAGFLSIQAQDFIEDRTTTIRTTRFGHS